MKIEALDHIVLLVADVERSLAWYGDVLGLEQLRVDEWRRGEVPFPSVRINGETIIDLFATADGESPSGRNVDHVCLTIAPTDLEELARSGRFDVRSGPAPRWGAQGMAESLYVRDPDGHVIELRHYGGAS